MPIEFPCPHCQQLLRTPDGTAGKQAKCPQCGGIAEIPGRQPEPFSRPVGGSPFFAPADEGGAAPDGPAAITDPNNPYAPPTLVERGVYPGGETAGERDGPPWERDGKSAGTFWQTCKLVFTSPTQMFATMRRTDGIGAPLLFALVGGMIGGLVTVVFNFGLQAAMLSIGAPQNQAAGWMETGLGLACLGGVMLIFVPIAVIIGLFINAGIVHLLLMLLGGNRFGFETTFRVAAYCTGATSLLLLIPFCGQYVQGLVNLVFMIFGLSAAQEISGGKAAAAVLLPMLICVLAVVAIIVVVGFTVLNFAPVPAGN